MQAFFLNSHQLNLIEKLHLNDHLDLMNELTT